MKIQIATCSIFISNNIMHLKPIKNNFFNKHFTKPENKLLIETKNTETLQPLLGKHNTNSAKILR